MLDSGQSDCHTILGGETAKLKTMVADPISISMVADPISTPFPAPTVDSKKQFGILSAMSQSTITIIDDKNLRGFVAPSSLVSKETLEDVIDMVEIAEISTPKEIRETERRIREADRGNSWVPAKEVEKRLKARLKSRK